MLSDTCVLVFPRDGKTIVQIWKNGVQPTVKCTALA